MTKKIIRLVFLCMSLYACVGLTAQTRKFTINGTIRDKATGETMIGVNVFPAENPSVGTSCNEYGFYSLSLSPGIYHIVCTYLGYRPDTVRINLQSNIQSDRMIEENLFELNEIVIEAEKKDDHVTKAQMGMEKLDIQETARLPIIFGEKDILKTIQLLPGVKSAGEGSSGFFVRGGSADQNLILLDEAPVYNASHLLGFFSTFNSDALKDVSILKGNSPAQYGGRLSSVLDVKMKDGNNQAFGASGGIGLISSRLSLEGPITKDKGSFIVSGRRTYADLFLQLSEDFKDNALYFYDLNLKANYNINDKNRIFLSGYFGRDKLGFGNTFGIDWGNKTGTFRWNSVISPRLFSNTSILYSDYNYNIELTSGGSDFNVNSEIRDWNLKQEFSFFLNDKNTIRYGVNSIYHTIIPSRFAGSGIPESQKKGRDSWDNAAFINNTMKVSPTLTLDYGLRLSSFTILGGDSYSIYDQGLLIDKVELAEGSFGKTYLNLEPRFQFSQLLSPSSSIKGGYARNVQNLHLLSNSTSGTPTDQWIGSSYNIKPQLADQYSLGYFKNLAQNRYQVSIEAYYKNLQNQVDYKDGADLQTAPDIESELLYGKGRAYGAEFLIKKTEGRLTGWLGYTLSRTERKIEGINQNAWYRARQDRTHDISLVTTYQLSPRWTLSGLWVYQTGNAVTFPSGKYEIDGNTTFYYSARNSYRMPAYHRMDLGATYTKPRRGRFESSWNFSLYNAYGRENAYTITFGDSESEPGKTVATQTSLFRWVPSVTYNFKF
jgi:outer membrane cobalamin receptor